MSDKKVQEAKAEQREKVLNYRQRLTDRELLGKSMEIKKKLFELKEFQEAEVIMFYIDFRNEVKTEFMIKEALKLGKRVLVPISQVEDRSLLLSELKDYDQELELGTYDILEPKKEYIRPVKYKKLDFVVVPGVAFDEECNRLGYGGGYYDRFSAKLDDNVMRAALAFEIQIVDEVITGEYDLPVDKVLTEERVIG
ncbi:MULTISPECIES: 5-formyltetrahydrofolate cyclo-ligase [unclassified Candidatus Frackibacter]|uniref:5-formyltetrahydrofolate cyclo-ligase n=1 Tax=unclassified Candidatus Frackibacter TaxID=2648818 RepID=UPI00088C0D96|nr:MULTISPECIES: 5-formyltetrahydrofolate cyclo-ligase [unclassified Candidatus Frackibacter]SDC64693.1 5-formyltetrahydrofolate cyclo-ligase [Candidatus Frackibacter sp. WG11]SEM77292.1 5-formyltetrahydrofolate cyclo-ligase [Candidatus Frackibacter sp. WG12]SFL88794.1 5-formyltetrahydrofolate cyclo-ligase [Candidatus Frackibacter sp. WG13]